MGRPPVKNVNINLNTVCAWAATNNMTVNDGKFQMLKQNQKMKEATKVYRE